MEEASRNVIDHCLQAFNAMELSKVIKTDSEPCYTGKNFISFCKEFGIKYKTGIYYNPMGQGIVEYVHHTLKNWPLKTKRDNYTPQGHQKHILLLSYLF
jgi:transposase InsO family protein